MQMRYICPDTLAYEITATIARHAEKALMVTPEIRIEPLVEGITNTSAPDWCIEGLASWPDELRAIGHEVQAAFQQCYRLEGWGIGMSGRIR